MAPHPQPIRIYRSDDRAACLALFDCNVGRYFDASERPGLEAFLDQPDGEFFVVTQAKALLACGGCFVRESIGRLAWGMVAVAQHRKGLGAQLLAWRVGRLFAVPEVSAVAIDTSQLTAGFYRRYGFRTTALKQNGFGEGLDQVSMALRRADWNNELRVIEEVCHDAAIR